MARRETVPLPRMVEWSTRIRGHGIDATIVAYTLRSRGFENVAVLLAGVLGWRLQRPELYGRYAGVNVTKLELRRRPRDA
ncbi:MAG: hypothetical protein JRS35_02870 [Deltaproteobacteria bacterium]|nr:hypothetical protein [Deltaproteobacteria bacterium]